jgi:predicted nucleotidyltransferase
MNVNTAVQALCDAGVEFVIIGGWAAILHGSAYLTNDLDICFSRKAENLKRLQRALAPFHPRLRDLAEDLPFVWDEATLRNGTVFTLTTDVGKVDLLAGVAGLGSFDEVKSGSVIADAFGRQVYSLDLKSLIQSKRAAGRAKDLMILPELESLLEAQEPEPSN